VTKLGAKKKGIMVDELSVEGRGGPDCGAQGTKISRGEAKTNVGKGIGEKVPGNGGWSVRTGR